MTFPVRLRRSLVFGLACAVAAACATVPPNTASARGAPVAARYDPSRDLGPLFGDVQMAAVFPDSKTFVDARPRLPPAAIAASYAAQEHSPGFDLGAFVARDFSLPSTGGSPVRTNRTATMEAHIGSLWTVLTRPPDRIDPRSSLIPLPHSYVVPGGRFREVYYWDWYFTMLGLLESGRADLVKDMLDNFAHLVNTVGHIPNGNRTYYLSRSQPPFFGAMIELYGAHVGRARMLPYLPALEAEYAFWMDGADTLAPGMAFRRVVRLPNGAILNRYWDDRPEPRPESYREDAVLAQRVAPSQREALYRNLRAAAESGWDFSSRWMRDPHDLTTIETTELAPVDLNSLLYADERLMASLRTLRGGPGDAEAARRFTAAADARRHALLNAAYDPAGGDFFDVRWRTGTRETDRPTLAAAVPLFFGLATPPQGRAVAARLEHDLLQPGGFVTTLIQSGQQWDFPNGWAPLEYMAIEGVAHYGRDDLAATARTRWLALDRRTYRATGKMMEKYDVTDLSKPAGGGEYPAQDGFGWTNGVALALSAEARGNPPAARPDAPQGAAAVVH